MSKLSLTKTRIQAGTYEGELTSTSPEMPRLEMHHLDLVVANVRVIAVKTDPLKWLVRVHIPSEFLTDGVQSFILTEVGSQQKLDAFTIITGTPLEDDIRAEVSLLRAELDMLKKAFRRHCVETQD